MEREVFKKQQMEHDLQDMHIKRKEWLDGLHCRLNKRDNLLLERASRTLVENVCVPEQGQKFPWDPWRGICPSPITYKGVWNWDSAFHMLAVSRWDTALAYEQAYLFYKTQNPDGSFADVFYANGTIIADSSKPPVFPWAAEQVHRRTKDDEFLKIVYPHFKKMENFWWAKRGGEKDGLFFYFGANPHYESGWDNSVRWDAYLKNMADLWPIDLNCYMVTFYRALQYMAEVLGVPAEAEPYKKREEALIEAIKTGFQDKIPVASLPHLEVDKLVELFGARVPAIYVTPAPMTVHQGDMTLRWEVLLLSKLEAGQVAARQGSANTTGGYFLAWNMAIIGSAGIDCGDVMLYLHSMDVLSGGAGERLALKGALCWSGLLEGVTAVPPVLDDSAVAALADLETVRVEYDLPPLLHPTDAALAADQVSADAQDDIGLSQ